MVNTYNIFTYCIDPHIILHLYFIQSKCTPLITAAGTKRLTAIVQVLLQAGANKDARDHVSTYYMFTYCIPPFELSYPISNFDFVKRNCTSLHWASDNNCVDTAKVLLEAGADVNIKNDVST